MAYYFRRSILLSRLVTRQVMFFQPQKFTLRNSNSQLFQSSLSRSYTDSAPIKSEKWKSVFFNLKKKFPVQVVQDKLYNINWKKLLFGSGFLFLVGDGIFVGWVYQSNERCINKTFEKGTRPQSSVLDDEYVSRPKDIERLKLIFQPSKNHSSYHAVCGEHGTGKTTLVRIVANEVGKGVIYINFPENFNELGDEFGKALNLTFEEDASRTVQLFRKIFGWYKDEFKSSYSKWERAMRVIKRASEVYKANNEGRPPVIIYDNVNQVISKNPEILDILQDGAKLNADERKYIAVFVSSEDSVPRRMESRSTWSRAKKPVIEIGDLGEKESKDYLIKRCTIEKKEGNKIIKKKCKINDKQVSELYKLVGGRIFDLKTVADDFLAGLSLEVIKQQILGEVEKKFQSAQLLPNDPYYEVGKSIISDLLKSKELSFLAYKKYFNRIDKLNEVLGSNIFAYHPEKNTVTFQSQSVESYILENLNIFAK